TKLESILLPHVVGWPALQRTSLIATGSPASSPSISPRFRLASTARACASAAESSTCRNACTFGSRFRIAWRNSPVSASDVVSPRESSPSSSTAVRSIIKLFASRYQPSAIQHRRHAVKIAAAVGRISERRVHGKRRSRFISAEDIVEVKRVGERLNAHSVHLLELVDVIEDRTELRRKLPHFVVAQFQPGQMRHPADLIGGKGHDNLGQNPKVEIRNSKQIQMSNPNDPKQPGLEFGFSTSDLFRLSLFGFRISQVRHLEQLALLWPLDAAAADALDANAQALHRPAHLHLDALEVGTERPPADSRHFPADAAEVLRLAAPGILIPQDRLLAADVALHAHTAPTSRSLAEK